MPDFYRPIAISLSRLLVSTATESALKHHKPPVKHCLIHTELLLAGLIAHTLEPCHMTSAVTSLTHCDRCTLQFSSLGSSNRSRSHIDNKYSCYQRKSVWINQVKPVSLFTPLVQFTSRLHQRCLLLCIACTSTATAHISYVDNSTLSQ